MASEDQWQTVCRRGELGPGDRRLVRTASGERVVVFCNQNNELRAVSDVCPHEGYPLSEGEVDGDTLTCCWHAFRFDLRTGACLKGDEAVRTFGVRAHDDLVQIDTRPPPTTDDRAARWASLADGLQNGRIGQVVRDLTRLRAAEVSALELMRWVVAWEARHAEYGTGHVLPGAVDVLAWLPRHDPVDALVALSQPFELAAEGLVRRPPRPTLPVVPVQGFEDVGARLRALAEAADAQGAEALLRGALVLGASRAQVSDWLYAITCDHFVDIGHHVIFLNKALDLLSDLGWGAAPEVLPALVVSIVDGTRHDTLPRWKWLRARLADDAPRMPGWWDRAQTQGPEAPVDVAAREALVALLGGSDRQAALDVIAAQLTGGAGLNTVLDALVLAGAERLLRFDTAHDANPDMGHGWLDVTHGFTYASALRDAVRRYDHPDVLRHVYFAARQIQALSQLDGPGDAAALWAAQPPPEQTRNEVERQILYHPWARPIVQVHFVKVATAAYAEAKTLADDRPLRALARLLAAPMQQRGLAQRVVEAHRLVHEGKVPRTKL